MNFENILSGDRFDTLVLPKITLMILMHVARRLDRVQDVEMVCEGYSDSGSVAMGFWATCLMALLVVRQLLALALISREPRAAHDVRVCV